MDTSPITESADDPPPIPSPAKKAKAQQRLRDHLENLKKGKETPVPITGTGKTKTLTTIKRAMSDYESTGRRPYILEQIYRALSTINPTSAEAGQN